MLKFSVPTNWQKNMISDIRKEMVEEVYGKLPADIIGGGRAAVTLPNLNKNDLVLHISEVKKNNLKFNYLLNSTCLNNLEWSISWQRKFRKFLDYLINIGVEKVTVSIPYLLELIKRNYPNLEVCVSVQAGVNSLRRAKFWDEMGASEITLFMDINRDFNLLRKIRKEIKCKLKLIANLNCLYGCPFYQYHANLMSHASQSWHFSRGFLIDYCTLRCRLIKLLYPEELIRSRWIRPEDIEIYEKLGIDILKFVNRDMKTEFISLIVKAYTERKYNGNLLDLFSSPSKNISEYKFDIQKFKYFFRPWKVNIFKLYKAKGFLRKDEIFIDNNKLDGFLKYFLENRCDLSLCDECGYCRKIANEVIKIPLEYKSKYYQKYKDFLDSILNKQLFTYF